MSKKSNSSKRIKRPFNDPLCPGETYQGPDRGIPWGLLNLKRSPEGWLTDEYHVNRVQETLNMDGRETIERGYALSTPLSMHFTEKEIIDLIPIIPEQYLSHNNTHINQYALALILQFLARGCKAWEDTQRGFALISDLPFGKTLDD